MMLQILRRTVQVSVVAWLAAVAWLSLYAHYRAAGVIDDPEMLAGLRGERIVRTLYPVVEKLDDPQAFLDANKGTLWSMRFFGLSLTDPLAAAEAIAATHKVHWPLLISVLIPVGLTLVFGRVFCSWICPGYLLFELTGKLRKLLRLAEIEPAEVRFSHRTKYLVLLVGLATAAVFSAPLFALIYPPAVISRALHAWIFGTALTGMLVILGVIIAVELFVSPRWWCRVVCPGGALYGLLGWARPVRIRLRKGQCTGCRACIPVCEEGINPITQSASIECDNCGVCIRQCGDGALYYTISLPGTRSSSHRDDDDSGRILLRTRRRKAVGVALLAMLAYPSAARAHRILGLPHYSYKEDYPQRPTLEYPAHTGPYDVLLTSYPGVPVPGEPANLAFYIKNRRTGTVYTEPISVRVLQTHTFGDNTIILPPTTRRPFDNEYKFYATFPEDGEYIVELSMPVEGRTEVIPFLIVAGQPTAAASFVIAGSFGAIVLFVVVRALRRKKRRRLAAAAGNSETRHGAKSVEGSCPA